MADDSRILTRSLRAIVRIQTPPEYDPATGTVMPKRLFGFDTAERGGPADDLISVTTSKRLHEPCGRFTLVFTPRRVEGSRTWADLIPCYSLVEIYLQQYPADPEPVLVMLGLTDGRLESETYAQASPERHIQVSGRELSCIFVDQSVLYLPVPPEDIRLQTPLAQVPGRQAAQELPPLFQTVTALLGMVAIDPELSLEGASPVDVVDRFVTMVRTGLTTSYNKTGKPLLNFEFPDAEIKDLLFFDREKAVAQLFDPSARLPANAQLSKGGTKLWHLLSTWSDPTYQELFTETRSRRSAALGDLGSRTLATNEIIFRKKPFGGRIDENGEVVGIRAELASQFDVDFEQDPTETITIGDQDVLALNLLRSIQNAVNLFYVYPQVPLINKQEEFRANYAPLIDAGDTSPSSIRRLGLRAMEVADYYFRDEGEQTIFVLATERARLLWAWHRFEPLFRTGKYTLRGNPHFRVGKRLVHRSREFTREYYLTGVSHSMIVGGKQPQFVSAIDVERGWPLLLS